MTEPYTLNFPSLSSSSSSSSFVTVIVVVQLFNLCDLDESLSDLRFYVPRLLFGSSKFSIRLINRFWRLLSVSLGFEVSRIDRRRSPMDFLPAETLQIVQSHGFRSLKLASVSMEDAFYQNAVGVEYGRLLDGLCYYVRSNSKPRMRATLALTVKVYPLFAAVGTAVGICAMHLVRNINTNPDVRYFFIFL
ncbi:hypothetical protein Syun_029855 [Stephania yunnanensis]|uniref:Uncharacterized protein n=1 Tax=Stephania yunnanensis TaxID=152371 RepID=A0AAP0E6E9_9MAGN